MIAEPEPRPSPSSRKVRLYWIAPAALALIVLCALLLFWAGQPKPFQKIAAPVSTVSEWRYQIIYPSFGNYYWLSNTELLIRPTAESQPSSYYRQRISPASPPLSRLICAPLNKVQGDLESISPDGRWAAISRLDKKDETLTIIALDGSGAQTWKYPPVNAQPLSFWMPDSRRFVVVGANQGTVPPAPTLGHIFTLNSPHSESFPIPALPNADRNNTGLVGFTSTDKAVFQLNNPTFQTAKFGGGGAVNYPDVSLVEIDLNHQGGAPRFFSLHVPRGIDFGMLFLSPKGNRIFWGGFSLVKPPLWSKWLNRWIPAVKAEQRLIETGWISDADGSHLHQLGYYEIPGDPNQPNSQGSKGPAWVLEPRWSPDGKRISFLFNDSIYTVPAN